MDNVSIILFLLFGITFLSVITTKYKFPYPVALVISGLFISLIPGLPKIELSPEVVFIIFLPPLLYSAAWNTSWHNFKSAIRPITLAAIGLVLFTTVAVAVVSHWMIADISWPLAFLIGAIVSPPDAVAATSVTKGLGLPPRLITVLEGESLVNDASGLVAYKYALTAIFAGNFILWQASLNFLWVAIAGIAVGLAIGYIMYLIHKNFICDPIVETTLTLLTPFASYLLAEQFHLSGVLAVVSSGLYLSFRSAKIFTHQSRIMAVAVWETAVYILNGLIFILIGLQLQSVMDGISDYSEASLILWGAAISAVVIIVRFIWVYPAALLPRYLSKRIRETEPFDIRNVFVFGWSGMRGVVSMAAALAIPLTLEDGSLFPHRNLVIYLTFCVILSTLVLLGPTLPWIIRLLKIEKHSIVAETYEVKTKVVSTAMAHIEENLATLPDTLLHNIKSKYEIKYNRLQKTELPANYFGQGKILPKQVFNEFSQLQIDMINVERKKLEEMHRKGEGSEEIIRAIERELDLEEARLSLEMYNA